MLNTTPKTPRPQTAVFIGKLATVAAIGLLATVVSSGCTKPKSAATGKPAAKSNVTPTSDAAPSNNAQTRHFSEGGVKLPEGTPRPVLDALKGLLASPDATTRVLVKLGASAAPAMVALTSSENIAEARAALTFFEKTRLPGGGEAAARLSASDVPSLRHQALITLATLGDKAHVAAVETALKEATDSTTRSLAIRALATLKTEGGTRTLVEQLDDADEQVTSEVAAALAGIDTLSPEIVETLHAKAVSPKLATAVGALTALRLRKATTKPALPASVLKSALGHPDARVVMAGIRLLERLADPKLKAAHFDRVLGDKRPGVRRVAVEVIASSGLPDAQARATKLMEDPDPEVAAQTVTTLARLLPADDRSRFLVPLLAHGVASVRQAAIVSLDELQDPPMKPLVARLALERDAMARTFIIRAIGRHKHQAAVPTLVALLGTKAEPATAKTAALKSLQLLTGQTIGMHSTRWRRWLEGQQAKPAPTGPSPGKVAPPGGTAEPGQSPKEAPVKGASPAGDPSPTPGATEKPTAPATEKRAP